MKFLLLALAVFGVAQANVIQPKSVNEALDKIRAAIPTDRIVEIVQACADDPEVQEIQAYLRNEFPAVVQIIRDDPAIQGFFEDLQDAGVVFEFLNHLFELWGIEPIARDTFAPKTCGGWRGVYEQIQEEFEITDIVIVISQVYDAYPEFAVVWDRIGAAQPIINNLLADPAVSAVFDRLWALGVDRETVLDFLAGLLGWVF